MSSKIKVLIVFGTRPEAIKMAPVYMELAKREDIEPIVCVTAQHREMLDQVLALFKIKPSYDLDVMEPNQNLWTLTSKVLLKMKDVIEDCSPHIVLVHGDTTTTLATSLSAFYAKTPIGHVEAGLRTFNRFYPFPEEINRVVTDSVSSYYFAPTDRSVDNLIMSGANKDYVFKTGNTVIDALLHTVNSQDACIEGLKLNPAYKTILMTSHRRENFGEPLENICHAVLDIVEKNKNVQVVYPVHYNPNVREPVNRILGNKERILLLEPMDYAPFACLMSRCDIILTDSGGIQEEAPSLGKPVLVLREETERPEAVDFGTVKLVGTDREKIFTTTDKLINDETFYKSMSEATNPYGDGLASQRIADLLLEHKEELISRKLYS